jgi:hypothetical protein
MCVWYFILFMFKKLFRRVKHLYGTFVGVTKLISYFEGGTDI